MICSVVFILIVKTIKKVKDMQRFLLILVGVLTVSTFISCEKEKPKEEINYSKLIVGTWQVTHIERDSVMVDITQPPYSTSIGYTSATFSSGGAYSSEGFFATGNGTYTIQGNIIMTFIEGEENYSYEIISLTKTDGTMKAGMTGSFTTIKFKCKKI